MWTIFKIVIEFVTIFVSVFLYVLLFGWEACGVLGPQPGIEPTSPSLEGEVLTIRQPGKFQTNLFAKETAPYHCHQ